VKIGVVLPDIRPQIEEIARDIQAHRPLCRPARVAVDVRQPQFVAPHLHPVGGGDIGAVIFNAEGKERHLIKRRLTDHPDYRAVGQDVVVARGILQALEF